MASVLLTLLAAIGLPFIAWLLGANWQSLGDGARRHPLPVLWLLVLYEVCIFILSVFTDTWKKIEVDLTDLFANRLKLAALFRFSRFEGDYRQYVYQHCRNFDIKGLSMEGTHTL